MHQRVRSACAALLSVLSLAAALVASAEDIDWPSQPSSVAVAVASAGNAEPDIDWP